MTEPMRKTKSVWKTLPISLAGLTLLAGCGPLTDLAFDCIDDDGPVLSPRFIPNPVLNQSYEVRINASIENEPFDDSFNYDIVISDTLPPGLSAFVFERQVRITGAATELGSYTFDISVAVDDPDSGNFNNNGSDNSNFSINGYPGNTSGLCRVNTQRTYELTVTQGS